MRFNASQPLARADKQRLGSFLLEAVVGRRLDEMLLMIKGPSSNHSAASPNPNSNAAPRLPTANAALGEFQLEARVALIRQLCRGKGQG